METPNYAVTAYHQTKEVVASMAAHALTKSAVSVIASFAALMLGRENYDLLSFVGILVALDLVTGMVASASIGEALKSRKVFKTATKSFVYLMFFSSAYLTHKIIPYSDFLVTGIMSFLAITEFFSIVENMAKMGYVLPQKLLNQIKEVEFGIPGKKKTGGYGSDKVSA